jgi:uncharacterized repeat protein (TIGR01451 family)
MFMSVRGVSAAVFGLLIAATAAAQSSDMFVTKNAPASANVGSNVTYTIGVGNGGPSDAPNASFTDTLPGGATFVSYQQNTGPTFTCGTLPNVGDPGGTVSCSIATLTTGTTATFTIVVNVSAQAAGTTLINSITVTSGNPDDNPENNSTTTGTSVPGGNQADVSILKTGPGSAPPNTNVTYTITVSNSAGPNAAQNVSWSDTLPSGTPPSQMTFVSFNQTGGPSFNCGVPSTTTTCTIASLAVGATATFQFVGHIPNGTGSGTDYTNNVAVTSANDPNSENDTSSTSLTVSSVDVGVTKSGPASAVAGGPAYNYTITLTNAGPDAANNAAFTDTLPSGLTFVSLMQNTGPSATCGTPPPNSGGTVTCMIALFSNGGSAQFTLTVQPLASIPNGTNIMNTATASTSSADTNPANDSSTASTTITAQADVSIVKSGAATATAGTNLTYTITASNNGPSDAQNIVVNDVLPGTETFVSLSAPGYSCTTPAVGSTGTVNCTRTTLIAGAMTTLTLVVQITPAATGTVSNTATIASATTDTNPNNNSSTASTTVSASADVAVAKTPAAAPSVNQVAFTVTVTNNGPSNATTVTMTDATPAGTTFVSEMQNSGPAFVCANPPVGGTGTTSCSIGTLVPGASATFTLVYQPTSSSPGLISNTANVTAATPDPNPANNSATSSSTVASAIPAATPLVLAALALALAALGMVVLRR